MKKKQNKKFIIITGASSGIGEACALLFAKEKKCLIICGRRKKRLLEVQKACLNLGSPEVLVFNQDFQSNQLAVNFKKFLALHKPIKINSIINNAGLAAGADLVQNAKISDWEAMINTNIKAVLIMTSLALPQIIEEAGHIVNLGSVAGRLVYEGGAVYCATKFAIRAFSEGLRMDLKGTGVRVTNIEPGMVNSEFSLVRLGSQQKAEAVYHDMMPLSASDIANNILWCLQQPPHVNIQELVIYPTDQASVGQVVRGKKSIRKLKK